MQKKSALTAALSGKPEPSAPAVPKSGYSDGFSFPCLSGRTEAAADESSDRFDELAVHSKLLAGSAPVAVHLANGSLAADYELNPYRRRGGEERVPSASTSVGDKWMDAASLNSNFVQESLIGSLPRGLSMDERMRVLASTPLSPALNFLSSLPKDKVGSRSVDGRKLRRSALHGAVIVFVTAGYSGKKFIFETAKELGVRSIIIDGPDSWSQSLVTDGMVEKFIGLDFTDSETVFKRCVEAIQKVKTEVGEIDGVCTFCEMAVPLVARLAEKFGLPGNTPQAVDQARDKHSTRTVMAAAGLPTPRNYLISDPADVKKAGDHVGFPAVIKPIFGAASIGVVRVDDIEALEKAYKRVVKEMAGATIVAGALQQGADEDDSTETAKAGNANSWIKLTLMLEEYLDGPEVDVDVIFSEGKSVYGAITDNWPTVEPYFNETGSNCPSILPLNQQRELADLAVAAVKCLGFTLGVFHVECKYTSRGARLIEVNCRMGGGPVHATNKLVWGVDLVEENLLTCAGIPSAPYTPPQPLKFISEYSINAAKTGRLQHTNFLQKWENHPDVLYAHYLVQAGQKCTAVTDGMPTWVCELMVTKPSVEEAIEFIKSIEADIDIPIV